MHWIHIIFWALALFGHVALCLAFYNRMHAAKLPRRVTRLLERTCLVLCLVGAAVWVWRGLAAANSIPSLASLTSGFFPLAVYVFLCAEVGCFIPLVWLIRRLFERIPAQLISNDTTYLDVAQELGERPIGNRRTRFWDCVPGNQMFELHIHEKTIHLGQLPRELDGLSIAHLSDLHFTGGISRSYFEFVAEQTMQLDADLIAITGDIIDNPRCLEWIGSTLGRLKSPLGVYYVLGNHEQHLRDVAAVRYALNRVGLTDLGGQVVLVEARGQQVLLAGNERPWLSGYPEVPAKDAEGVALRVLLSHSPDQIRWAQKHAFDLMLAGHNHGGQVRLPVIGPIVSPSNYGVKYASGLFFEPPTLLHVTRGISAQIPLRIRCAPELAKLVLKAC